MENRNAVCPECSPEVSRREFIHQAGRATIAAAGAVVLGANGSAAAQFPTVAVPKGAAPESLVKLLHESLSSGQRDKVVLPWSHAHRKRVDANWKIVESTIGDTFSKTQQELIGAILKGVTNEEWYPKILSQMKGDSGGLENYHVALFHNEANNQREWVLTGRHTTIRCGGDPNENMAFGGPIFYGHAVKDTEDPGHPGNVFWYQAKQANAVFAMLDGKQRDQALIAKAPDENSIAFRKDRSAFPGIAVGDLSKDQKGLVKKVIADLLAPYRKRDVDEVVRDLQANGGMDALHLAFYKQEDLGNDGIWDIWRLEGPAFVWHFRGAPHVHTWVNIGSKPAA